MKIILGQDKGVLEDQTNPTDKIVLSGFRVCKKHRLPFHLAGLGTRSPQLLGTSSSMKRTG